MQSNFRIINNDEKLRKKLKKKANIDFISTVAVICFFLLAVVLAIVACVLDSYALLNWAFSVGIVTVLLCTIQKNTSKPSLSANFLNHIKDGNVINAEMTIEGNPREQKRAKIRLTVENINHIISYHAASFPVEERTDVTEYTLDLLDETVYIPYIATEEREENENA